MCSCNGGKPVNLRANAGAPLVDPYAKSNVARVVKKSLSRNDFIQTGLKLVDKTNIQSYHKR